MRRSWRSLQIFLYIRTTPATPGVAGLPRIHYTVADDVERLARDVIEKLEMKWIKAEYLRFLRSSGSKTTAVARIYGLPRTFQVAFNLPPLYVIEVVSEKFDALTPEEKVRVIVHELLHIPKSFSGGLRPHGKAVNSKAVSKLVERYFSVKFKR